MIDEKEQRILVDGLVEILKTDEAASLLQHLKQLNCDLFIKFSDDSVVTVPLP
ncbi:hypothetical protein [Gallionella capsiferriformans]|uniref:Uncharacterized protein n=1 Tax=Gallionella capsiferriformans (strain ES-2) TaxID=395494 RepID=D9SDH1_GALCS|nr:hypothetical protein [Gallionella capsiferriformans]ADL56769.1 hypothetical protein Galf_2774 [Gallionella capsiferriformans ES-2]